MHDEFNQTFYLILDLAFVDPLFIRDVKLKGPLLK